MKINSKKLPQSSIECSVELSAEEFASYQKTAINEAKKTVQIPGFRAGHVPENMVISYLGQERILEETQRIIISSLYADAVKEAGVKPVSEPKVNITSLQPYAFTYTFDYAPEIDLGKYRDIKVSTKKAEATKKEIADFVEQFRKEIPDFKEVKRKAKMGDRTEIHFDGFTLEGEPVPNTSAKNFQLVLGSKQLIPGFEENIVDLKAGESKEFTIPFPVDYPQKAMAGNTYKFKIEVVKVEESVLHEVNDEFVEKLTGKKGTIKDLEDEIEKSIIIKKTRENRSEAENELLKKLRESIKFELPASMVEEEKGFIIDNVKMGGLERGLPWEKYLEAMKKTEEDIRKEVTPEAEDRVKSRLILIEIIKKEAINIAEELVKKEADHALLHVPKAQQKAVEKEYKEGGRYYEQIKNMMYIQKVFDSYLGEMPKEEHHHHEHDHA